TGAAASRIDLDASETTLLPVGPKSLPRRAVRSVGPNLHRTHGGGKAREATMAPHDRVTQAQALPPQLVLYQMSIGHYVSRALALAAKLRLADLLADGPRHHDELARSTETHAPALNRVMRLLASVGVFDEQEDGRFALTPLGDALRTDVPGS